MFQITLEIEAFPRWDYYHIIFFNRILNILDDPRTAPFYDIIDESAFFMIEFFRVSCCCFLVGYGSLGAIF